MKYIFLSQLLLLSIKLSITLCITNSHALSLSSTATQKLWSKQPLPKQIDTFIIDIHQTQDGFYWLGTTHGLFRYDGSEPQAIELTYSKGEPIKNTPTVLSITEGNNGQVWIGTTSGIYVYTPQTHQARLINGVIPTPVKRIAYKDGFVFALSYSEGPIILSDKLAHPENDQILDRNPLKQVLFPNTFQGTWADLIIDESHLWALDTKNTLWRINLFEPQIRRSVKLNTANGTLARIANGVGHTLWLTSDNNQLFTTSKINLINAQFNGELSKHSDIPGKRYAISKSYNKLYIANSYEFKQYLSSDNFKFTSIDVGIIDDSQQLIEPRNIFTDKQGNTWLIGHGKNQLYRIDATTTAITSSSSSSPVIHSTRVEQINQLAIHNSTLYLASEQGLWQKDLNSSLANWQQLSSQNIKQIINHTGEKSWFWDGKTLFVHSDNLTALNHPSCNELVKDPVDIYQLENNQQLLFEHSNGMILIANNKCERLTDNNTLPAVAQNNRRIFAVARLGIDSWLIASRWGMRIYSFKQNQTTAWQAPGINSKPAFNLDKIGDSIYIALNQTDLHRFDTSINKIESDLLKTLPGESLIEVLAIDNKQQLVITDQGLYSLNTSNKEPQLNYVALPQLNISKGQFSVYNGLVIFHLDGRLYQFKIDDLLSRQPQLPTPYIKSLQKQHQDQLYIANQALQLNQEQQHFAVQLGFIAPNTPNVKLQYRIAQLDQQWIDISRDNWAHFIRPPTGKYTLETQVVNSITAQTLQGSALKLEVQSPQKQLSTTHIVIFVMVFALIIIAIAIWVLRLIKNHQQQLIVLEAQQTQVLAFKNYMLAAISHELKTPLTTINSPLQILKQRLNNNTTDNELVAIIERSTQRIGRFISQILTLAKLNNNIDANQQVLPLDLLLTQAVENYQDLAQQNKLNITTSFEVGIKIKGNAHAIEILTSNLLSNAIRHRGPSIEEQHIIALSLKQTNQQATLTICDHGQGYPDQDRTKMFDPYSDKENYAATGSQQTGGLGLILVREIVNSHQGTMVIGSSQTKGNIIDIQLPICDEPLSQIQYSSTEHQPPQLAPIQSASLQLTDTAPSSDKQILIVEDDLEIQNLLKNLLANYQLSIANNAKQGLELVETLPIDLVITDQHMGGMTGIELTDIIRNQTATSHIPVIIMSADNEQNTQLAALEGLADIFIPKPFENSLLLAQIHSLLENRKQLSPKVAKAEHTEEQEDNLTTEQQFIANLHQLIEKNYTNSEFKLSDYLEQLGLSERNLRYKMQALTGESPTNYVYQYRLEKAKQQLESDLTFEQIAQNNGFKNARQFRKRFLEYIGLSPSDMRKQLQAQNNE